jgi:hypothetical protein
MNSEYCARLNVVYNFIVINVGVVVNVNWHSSQYKHFFTLNLTFYRECKVSGTPAVITGKRRLECHCIKLYHQHRKNVF